MRDVRACKALCAVVLVALVGIYFSEEAIMSGGTLYRNTVWLARGVSLYTRGGYEKAARGFDAKDMEVDITQRSYMVTGANSGLGKSAALSLAMKGATVHLVCRSQERGEEARLFITQQSGNQNVKLHLLDMSKPRDIVQFAKGFVAAGEPLDVLINNAGCMINERQITEDGLERNFATNTLSGYILTSELLPALARSSAPRVITVSSGGMLTEKLDPHDLNLEQRATNFDGTFAYAQNKRQQVVMSRRLAQKHPNIHFSTMHPGWADTPGVQTGMPKFHSAFQARLRTVEQGADTIVWLAIAERARQFDSGLFFEDRKPVPEHLPLARSQSSDEDEQLLMTKLEELRQKFAQQE